MRSIARHVYDYWPLYYLALIAIVLGVAVVAYYA